MTLLSRVPRPLRIAAFWVAVIAMGVLALLPVTMPLPSTGWDKANHALAFAFVGVLGAACWPGSVVRVLPALLAYGGAIEIAQTFTETRMGEWVDFLADGVGLAIAAAFIAWDGRRANPGR